MSSSSSTLSCSNCDSIASSLDVWCVDCFKDDDDLHLPCIYCQECNAQLHKPQKMHSHRRFPFEVNTEQKSSSLCDILCSNCEEPLVPSSTQWCLECCLILCKECSRELHNPQKKRSHQRFPFPYLTISPLSSSNTNKQITSPSSRGSYDPQYNKNNTSNASSNIGSAQSSQPSSALSSISMKSVASKVINQNLFTTIVKSKQKHEQEANLLARPPGDVLQLGEVSLNNDMLCTSLVFRQSHNVWDIMGSNVQIVQISCGHEHVGAVTQAGTLFMWGSNVSGELGVETGEEKTVFEPLVVEFPQEVKTKQVACGTDHTICCSYDEEVWTWGSGLMGKLGHESDMNCETPKKVNLNWCAQCPADSNQRIVMVAAGAHNSGVVVKGRADKKQLYTWGAGEYGQCGAGDRLPRLQPVLVQVVDPLHFNTPPELIQLAWGTNHAVVVSNDGAVYSFGSNQFGQLGTGVQQEELPDISAYLPTPALSPSLTSSSSLSGASDCQLSPKLIASLRVQNIRIKQAACGELSTSLLASDGSVWSCGSGESHQLGYMENEDQFVPVRAAVLGVGGEDPQFKAVHLAVGVSSCSAVTESGDVYMWGWSIEKLVPTLVAQLRSNFIQAVEIGAHNNVVCLTGLSNEIYEWRFTEDDDLSADVEPQQNRQLRGKRLTSISVGKGRCAASTMGGRLLQWGESTAQAEIENGEEYDPYKPKEIPCLWPIREVKCSSEHSVALTNTGQVLTWGASGSGRLGLGQHAHDYTSPTLVEALKNEVCVSIAIGPLNTGAVTKEGAAYVWGAGNSGALGNNNIEPVLIPTRIAALQHVQVSQIAFGNRHTLVSTTDGGLYSFGDNTFGQLGLGPNKETKYLLPQFVETLKSHTCSQIACGDNVSFMLTQQGELFGWGAAETKQLCVPDGEEDILTPIRINFPFKQEVDTNIKGTRIKEISINAINCAALADNGTVWVWGFCFSDESTNPNNLPTRVEYMSKQGMRVEKLAMGPAYMLLAV